MDSIQLYKDGDTQESPQSKNTAFPWQNKIWITRNDITEQRSIHENTWKINAYHAIGRFRSWKNWWYISLLDTDPNCVLRWVGLKSPVMLCCCLLSGDEWQIQVLSTLTSSSAKETPGPSCSRRHKLNELVKGHFVNCFSRFNIQYSDIFCWKNVSSFCIAKATHIFSAKNFRIFAYHSM